MVLLLLMTIPVSLGYFSCLISIKLETKWRLLLEELKSSSVSPSRKWEATMGPNSKHPSWGVSWWRGHQAWVFNSIHPSTKWCSREEEPYTHWHGKDNARWVRRWTSFGVIPSTPLAMPSTASTYTKSWRKLHMSFYPVTSLRCLTLECLGASVSYLIRNPKPLCLHLKLIRFSSWLWIK